MKMLILSSVAVLSFATTPVIAQSSVDQSLTEEKIQADDAVERKEVVSYGGVIDANGNQTFSIEEIATAYPGITVKAFNAMDTDQSGELNTAELATAKKKGILPN